MITVTPVKTGCTTYITATSKTTTAARKKRGRVSGPAVEREAGGITIRARWTTTQVEESRVRKSIGIIIHTGIPEGAMG